MSHCCSPGGYRWVFSERKAEADARRYRRRGLDETSRRIVELVTRRDLRGRTLLEVGGGIGAIQIELLKAGIAKAVSVELTPTYEAAAGALLREAGLRERVERRVMDFAGGDGVDAADIVILNRVLCCYGDMPGLAGAAAAHARELLIMSFPKERWWTRLGLRLANLLLRTMRRQFQVFLHSPDAILATAQRHGLRTATNEAGLIWQIATLTRSGGNAVPPLS